MERATARQIAGIAVLGGVALVAALTLSPAEIARRATTLAARPALFTGVLIAAYLLRPFVAWPISVLSVVVGVVLGPAGIPVALGGAVLTCLPPYAVARYLDHEVGFLGSVGEQGRRYFGAAGSIRGVAAARLAPLPADPVSYTAGLASVPLVPYLVGTAIGEFPWVAAGVLVGASAEAVTADGFDSGLALVVGGTALAVLLLSRPAYQYVRDRSMTLASVKK